MDVDTDGRVSFEEFRQHLKLLSLDAEPHRAFEALDRTEVKGTSLKQARNRGGLILFDEFCRWVGAVGGFCQILSLSFRSSAL